MISKQKWLYFVLYALSNSQLNTYEVKQHFHEIRNEGLLTRDSLGIIMTAFPYIDLHGELRAD
jgi:hypothetical protein